MLFQLLGTLEDGIFTQEHAKALRQAENQRPAKRQRTEGGQPIQQRAVPHSATPQPILTRHNRMLVACNLSLKSLSQFAVVALLSVGPTFECLQILLVITPMQFHPTTCMWCVELTDAAEGTSEIPESEQTPCPVQQANEG